MPTALADARAVVLYGRIGTYTTRSASLRLGMPGDAQLWKACAETISKHVMQPWQSVGRVDVFIQSWNMEMAKMIDEYWHPRMSDHGEQNNSIGRCPVKLAYCGRTMWALLGMKRALALRTRWASLNRRSDAEHVAVLVMRHDLFWKSPLPPLRADLGVRLWLPFDCQRASCHDDASRASELYSASVVPRTSQPERCTSNSGGQFTERTTIYPKKSVLGVRCNPSADASSRPALFCANSVNIDWWWAGDSSLADGFQATFDQFDHYSRLVSPYSLSNDSGQYSSCSIASPCAGP